MKKVFAIGDLHGSFKPVRELYKRHPYTMKDSILICLGDFGANYYLNERDRGFKKKLGKYPFTYFVVRGNHEARPSDLAKANPEAWTLEMCFSGAVWVEKEFPYIKYAMDLPWMYRIPVSDEPRLSLSTLVVPGAYSVDKYWRLERGMSWFENEQLTEKEMEHGWKELALYGNKVDIILSHTCPIIFEPTDLFLPQVDQSMVDKTMERYLGEIEFKTDYKMFLWGHYHQFRDYPRTDGKIKTMLDWNYAIDVLEHFKGKVEKL